MVSMCLPSGALSQHLLSHLGFSYLGREVSLHGCSSKVQLLLLTLEMYPTSEVKAVAERSYRMPEVRGGSQDELPHTQDQGWWWRGATPNMRSGAVAERSNSMSKEWRLHGCRRAERSFTSLPIKRKSTDNGR